MVWAAGFSIDCRDNTPLATASSRVERHPLAAVPPLGNVRAAAAPCNAAQPVARPATGQVIGKIAARGLVHRGGKGLAPGAGPTPVEGKSFPLALFEGLAIVDLLSLLVDAPPVDPGRRAHDSGRRCDCDCDGGVGCASVRRGEGRSLFFSRHRW